MAKRFGLRTEIIVNLILLMGAALLFSGLLLLNFLEREMIGGRVENARQQMVVVARFVEDVVQQPGTMAGQREFVRKALGATSASWFMLDEKQEVVASEVSSETILLREPDVSLAQIQRQEVVTVEYASFYQFWSRDQAELIVVTVPIYAGDNFLGALQGSFSLLAVKESLRGVSRFYLMYVGIYGGILLWFGTRLLGKTVVHPVHNLTDATARVAQGELVQAVVPEGPREMTGLTSSFNDMTAALWESREQGERSMALLRQANEELSQTRDELVRSERLASVGHLAAGMAHEIGNPLGAIVGYLELLRAELPAGREHDIAARAGVEAGRIDRLVRDLLDYAVPGTDERKPVAPGEVLAEVLDLLSSQGVLANLKIENSLPPSLPMVDVDRHKLQQVCINLLLNARDAIIDSLPPTERDGEVLGTIRLAGGATSGEVWFSIGDTGGGIAPDLAPHIFDPFFTTKAPGRGRGLGLSVCHRILSEAGGSIGVDSAAGTGSTFTVRLKRSGENRA